MLTFKKTWHMQSGCDPIITKRNSSLDLLELDMLKLSKGGSKAYNEKDKEYSLIILGGNCSVTGDGFRYEKIGKRRNVFDGAATAVYLPGNRKFTVTAETDVSIAVCKSPGDQEAQPVLVKPEDVVIKDLGKDGWKRQAHFIIDERIPAKHLYIGESYVASGMWPAIRRTSTMRTKCRRRPPRKRYTISNSTRLRVLGSKEYTPGKGTSMKRIRSGQAMSLRFREAIIRFAALPGMIPIICGSWAGKPGDFT